MNKFFRLVSMFAIAGATFAYTSCTDYSEDINKANDRIDQVVSDVESLKSVKDQVESLKTTVAGLETAQAKAEASITELQTALKALQDKHAEDIAKLEKDYAAADAALKSEIQGKIDALTKTHTDDVKAINASIAALEADVKTLKEKAATVEALIPTLATKKDLEEVSNQVAEQIKTINTTIGTLQGNLEVAQKNITALENRMTTAEGDITALQTAVKNAQKAAEDAQTAADNAQEDATTALGNIESLKKALGKYAEVGELEAKIAALEKMDSTLKADKFNTKDFTTTFAGELKNVIGVYAEKKVLEDKIAALDSKDEELAGEIVKVDAKLDSAKTELEGKISVLDTKVEKYNTEINDRIDSVLGIIAGRLSSIAFVPQYYYDGVPAILFETIAYNPLAADKENEVATVVTGDNEENNSEYANLYKNFTSALATAKYRLNPRTVGADCADFSFVGDKADYVFTRATAPAAPVSIEGTPEYDAKTGYVTFSVKKNEKLNVTANENKNLDIVALKAVLKQGLTDAEKEATEKPEVYSEYAHVNEIVYDATDVAISDKAELAKKSQNHEYSKTFEGAKVPEYVYQMPYDKPFDLGSLVATCISTNTETAGLENKQSHVALDLAKYNLEYKFSVAKTPYNIVSGETTTNQQTVIKCTDEVNGIYEVISANGAEHTKEAIGRTPIVRVDLMHNGNIVTRAFIKLIITVTKAADITVSESEKPRSITLGCPEDTVDFKFSEERLRREIYRVFNISHEEFWNTYEYYDSQVYVNGKVNTTFTNKPELKSGVSTEGTATKKITWNFTHKEVGTIGTGKAVVGRLILKNKLASSALPNFINFEFAANFSLPAVSIDVTRNEIFWKDNMYQVNVNVPEAVDSDASKCQFNNAMYTANGIGEQAWKKFVVKNVPCGETGAFVIVNVVENGKSIAYDKSSKGVTLETVDGVTYIKLDKTNADVKAALNSAKGLQAELKYKITYKSGDVVYPEEGNVVVNFVKPLNLNLPEGLSVKDAVTGGDKVNFDHRDLLTDWRGYAVLKDEVVPTTRNWYEWVKVCGKDDKHEATYVPETQVVETPASLDVEYQTITINTGNIYYSATVQLYDWKKNGKHDPGSWVKVRAYTEKGRSYSEAIQNAETKAKSVEDSRYFDGVDYYYTYLIENHTEETASSSIEFESVKSVTYTPAKYKTIEGHWEYADCTAVPTEKGDYVGQVIGCYEWTLKTAPDTKVVAGQYWNYYGPISDIVLDLTKVSTNLDDKKLPAKASLTQTGTTVTYNNVESPINRDYEIYIPAKVTYGWGTLTGTLTITVNPVSTIQ